MIDVLRFKEYSRLTGDTIFREIAELNFTRYKELNEKTKILKNKISEILSGADDPHDPPIGYYDIVHQVDPVEKEMHQCAIIVIVFSAMYLESFIYDYAASCLGDGYVKSHIDKLDMVSKWLIIPKLITGKQINKESQAFESLKLLNKARNALVHLKSKKCPFGQKLRDYLIKSEEDLDSDTRNAIRAMRLVIIELNELDPGHPRC